MNEEGIERLTSFVERTKIPKSIFIREAILQALDKYEKRQKGDEFP